MLELMRKHARNWLMKVLLGIIIIVFIFYFGSIGGKQKAETVATVDGKAISYVELQKEYQDLLDAYRQRFGAALTEETLKVLNLKQQALDNLINRSLILQRCEAQNLGVSDAEVRAAIISIPAFQNRGVFDEALYQRALRMNKTTPEDFELFQKRLLTIGRLEYLVQESPKISDREVQDLYRMQSEKIDIQYIKVLAKDFRVKVAVSTDALESYLKEQTAQFRVPDQIQLKYIAFLGSDYAPAQTVTDAEVADYYQRHREGYKDGTNKIRSLPEVQEKIRTELKFAKGMSAASLEAKKAHDIIYQEENFDAYATKNRLTLRKTPLFSAKSIPPDLLGLNRFESMAFSLKKDELSRVTAGDQGYYLFQLLAQKPSYLPPLKEIEAEVSRRYIDAQASLVAKQEAEALLESLKKGAPWDATAAAKRLKIADTGFFQPGTPIPILGSSRDLDELLLLLSEKKPYPDKVAVIDGGFVVIRFKARQVAEAIKGIPNREALANLLLQLKKHETVQAWMESIKAQMIQGGRLKINKEAKEL